MMGCRNGWVILVNLKELGERKIGLDLNFKG